LIDEERLPEELEKIPSGKNFFFIDQLLNKLRPQDIGIGISQVLPVIVGAIINKSSILAIEQPELHIHTKMQVELGDLFIEQINKQKNRIFLIETHSEHLMLRLLKRIRQTTKPNSEDKNKLLQPDQLAIYFFESNEGVGSVKKIRVDERGKFIDRWPQGFFDERFGEIV